MNPSRYVVRYVQNHHVSAWILANFDPRTGLIAGEDGDDTTCYQYMCLILAPPTCTCPQYRALNIQHADSPGTYFISPGYHSRESNLGRFYPAVKDELLWTLHKTTSKWNSPMLSFWHESLGTTAASSYGGFFLEMPALHDQCHRREATAVRSCARESINDGCHGQLYL